MEKDILVPIFLKEKMMLILVVEIFLKKAL